MSKITKVMVLVILVIVAGLAWAQQPQLAADTTVLPKNTTIRCLQIPAYTFPFSEQTNCYIIAGQTGQAIIIDPADQLDPIVDKTTGAPLTKILADKETGEATVIDAGKLGEYKVIKTNNFGDPTVVQDPATGKEKFVYDQFRTTNTYGPKILKVLADAKLTLKYIVITHGHLDHFGAVTYLQQQTGAQVLMHRSDLRTLAGGKLLTKEGAAEIGYPKDTYRIVGLTTRIDRILKDGELISLDGMVLKVINTPGHSPGGICLWTRQDGKGILFSGDTLLHWGYLRDALGNVMKDEQGNLMTSDTGRTNFVDGSGDEALLYRSIHDKLFALPDKTVVYPGHYETTTIGEEKKYSPARFVQPAK